MLSSFDTEQSLYNVFGKLAGIKKSCGKKKLFNSALIFALGKEMKRWQHAVGYTVPIEKTDEKKKVLLSYF